MTSETWLILISQRRAQALCSFETFEFSFDGIILREHETDAHNSC